MSRVTLEEVPMGVARGVAAAVRARRAEEGRKDAPC